MLRVLLCNMHPWISKSVNDVTRVAQQRDDVESDSDAVVSDDGSDEVFLQVRPPISVGRLFGLTGCELEFAIP